MTQLVRNASTDEFKSIEAATESFLHSERSYVENGLRIGYETFLNRLEVHNKCNHGIISDKEIEEIFGNYRTLYNANSKLFDDLMQLRLIGKNRLKEGLGQCMVDFIPYFRLYTDYIVNKRDAIVKLEDLKKHNKKFRQFLKINEMCVQKKLKTLLEEPVTRLPSYLQQMADIYMAFEKEQKDDNNNNNTLAANNLLKAIKDIKNVTDEIAIKCKDKKARRMVGVLQKEVFGNKIKLLASHRYVVTHSSAMNLIIGDKLKPHVIILCNDILVIGTMSGRLKNGDLVAVFPLIGLRISKNPSMDFLQQQCNVDIEGSNKDNKDKDDNKNAEVIDINLLAPYRFAVIPQNKNFTPSESNSLGSVVISCNDEKQMENWIDVIEDTVDIEEHNLNPCNPVDLEKRIRKLKTSKEGNNDTIRITDSVKLKEIEQWKKERELNGGKSIRKKSSHHQKSNSVHSKPPPKSSVKKSIPPSQSNNNNNNNTDNASTNGPPPPQRSPPNRNSLSGAKPPNLPPKKPPNRNSMTGNRPNLPPKKSPFQAPNLNSSNSLDSNTINNKTPKPPSNNNSTNNANTNTNNASKPPPNGNGHNSKIQPPKSAAPPPKTNAPSPPPPSSSNNTNNNTNTNTNNSNNNSNENISSKSNSNNNSSENLTSKKKSGKSGGGFLSKFKKHKDKDKDNKDKEDNNNNTASTNDAPVPPSHNNNNNGKPNKPPPSKPAKQPPPNDTKKNESKQPQARRRNALLGSIEGFKSKQLKHVDVTESDEQKKANTTNDKKDGIQGLLKSTLQNYRQFVMDDDDQPDDEDDDEWK